MHQACKVDYSMEENIYMLRSDMNLNISSGTAGYNNEVLVSDSGFSLGKYSKVNASVPKTTTKGRKVATHTTQGLAERQAIIHKEERAALIPFLTGGLNMWFMFR